ncbi:winged helix DNA-binding domain-containing protein [Streptomyces sp. HU2014]|uniref:winged helix DNA-binding domain-containing protein n=1 Tax=Streptomyces sp. HU2014 TaxID=2939414 RepID=UPI00200E3313|nr:winged helix DNA-binding domain-containing protein [Streptomyces sp. HU2014]UQI47159.1 winged helix DNA-binding domain-containing protein [Streptomyces sp. HU2014]
MTTDASPTLTVRALNRALLERQLLLRRAALPALDAVGHLAGLQAQSPMDPYHALAARLDGFDPEELSGLLASRAAVRVPLMRGTIHLVGAPDAHALYPLLRPVHERAFQGSHGKRLTDLDPRHVAAFAEGLLAERPRTLQELGPLLAGRWPGHDPAALAAAARALLPLVQVTPRALWGRGGAAAWTTLGAWTGEAGTTEAEDLGGLVLRYLAAFGPASVKDAQTWSGLTRLRATFEQLRPGLRTFRDPHGTELFDLPDGPLPDPGTPAPVRLLPEFDNIALSHADRARIMDPAHRSRVWRVNRARCAFLVDGFIGGVWRVEKARDAATLTLDPFAPLTRADRAGLEREAAGVLAMTAPGARHEVRFGEVP